MTEEKEKIPREEKPDKGGISRRQFLAGTGLVVGGAALGSIAILSACKTDSGATATVTSTVTKTVTQTGTGGTSTVTVTSPPTTVTTTTTATPAASAVATTTLDVNGTQYVLAGVKTTYSLLHVLREGLGLTAAKEGCDRGACASCTVIADGRAVLSCMIMAVEAEGMKITTLEGLSNGIKLSPVQQLFFDNDAFQCGYCTPGFVMAAKALLDKTPKPTVDQVREAVSGHLCVCANVMRSVETIAKGVS